MAVTIIATPGAIDANSFQTVAEIDLYYEGRAPQEVADEWTELDDDQKAAAAVTATDWMVSLIVWTGFPTSLEQALPWPRNSMLKREGLSFVENNVIPREVKNAHAELSRLLASTDRTVESDTIVQGISSLKAGPVTLMFRDRITTPPSVLSDSVINLLVPSWIDYITSRSDGTRDVERA